MAQHPSPLLLLLSFDRMLQSNLCFTNLSRKTRDFTLIKFQRKNYDFLCLRQSDKSVREGDACSDSDAVREFPCTCLTW